MSSSFAIADGSGITTAASTATMSDQSAELPTDNVPSSPPTRTLVNHTNLRRKGASEGMLSPTTVAAVISPPATLERNKFGTFLSPYQSASAPGSHFGSEAGDIVDATSLSLDETQMRSYSAMNSPATNSPIVSPAAAPQVLSPSLPHTRSLSFSPSPVHKTKPVDQSDSANQQQPRLQPAVFQTHNSSLPVPLPSPPPAVVHGQDVSSSTAAAIPATKSSAAPPATTTRASNLPPDSPQARHPASRQTIQNLGPNNTLPSTISNPSTASSTRPMHSPSPTIVRPATAASSGATSTGGATSNPNLNHPLPPTSVPVQVFCRFRPCLNEEPADHVSFTDESVTVVVDSDKTDSGPFTRKGAVTEFKFQHVFQPNASQTDVYERIVEHGAPIVSVGGNSSSSDFVGGSLIDFLFRGLNSTIMAYGQTGTGKSWSMEGPTSSSLLTSKHAPPPSVLSSPTSPSAASNHSREEQIAAETLHSLRGLIPRLAENIFRRLHEQHEAQASAASSAASSSSIHAAASLSSNTASSVTVHVSFFELYRNKIRDLLAHGKSVYEVDEDSPLNPTAASSSLHDRPAFTTGNSSINPSSQTGARSLQLQIKDKQVVVVGLSERTLQDSKSVLKALKEGQKYRTIARTNANAYSSRGHAIFDIFIKQTSSTVAITASSTDSNEPVSESITTVSRLRLVDLAGSEQNLESGLDLVRLEEARSINRSLTALGKVISSLAEGHSKHINYRDSLLTRIMSQSLGGNAITMLLITCSPSKQALKKTINTLRFGANASNISNAISVNRRRMIMAGANAFQNWTIPPPQGMKIELWEELQCWSRLQMIHREVGLKSIPIEFIKSLLSGHDKARRSSSGAATVSSPPRSIPSTVYITTPPDSSHMTHLQLELVNLNKLNSSLSIKLTAAQQTASTAQADLHMLENQLRFFFHQLARGGVLKQFSSNHVDDKDPIIELYNGILSSDSFHLETDGSAVHPGKLLQRLIERCPSVPIGSYDWLKSPISPGRRSHHFMKSSTTSSASKSPTRRSSFSPEKSPKTNSSFSPTRTVRSGSFHTPTKPINFNSSSPSPSSTTPNKLKSPRSNPKDSNTPTTSVLIRRLEELQRVNDELASELRRTKSMKEKVAKHHVTFGEVQEKQIESVDDSPVTQHAPDLSRDATFQALQHELDASYEEIVRVQTENTKLQAEVEEFRKAWAASFPTAPMPISTDNTAPACDPSSSTLTHETSVADANHLADRLRQTQLELSDLQNQYREEIHQAQIRAAEIAQAYEQEKVAMISFMEEQWRLKNDAAKVNQELTESTSMSQATPSTASLTDPSSSNSMPISISVQELLDSEPVKALIAARLALVTAQLQQEYAVHQQQDSPISQSSQLREIRQPLAEPIQTRAGDGHLSQSITSPQATTIIQPSVSFPQRLGGVSFPNEFEQSTDVNLSNQSSYPISTEVTTSAAHPPMSTSHQVRSLNSSESSPTQNQPLEITDMPQLLAVLKDKDRKIQELEALVNKLKPIQQVHGTQQIAERQAELPISPDQSSVPTDSHNIAFHSVHASTRHAHVQPQSESHLPHDNFFVEPTPNPNQPGQQVNHPNSSIPSSTQHRPDIVKNVHASNKPKPPVEQLLFETEEQEDGQSMEEEVNQDEFEYHQPRNIKPAVGANMTYESSTRPTMSHSIQGTQSISHGEVDVNENASAIDSAFVGGMKVEGREEARALARGLDQHSQPTNNNIDERNTRDRQERPNHFAHHQREKQEREVISQKAEAKHLVKHLPRSQSGEEEMEFGMESQAHETRSRVTDSKESYDPANELENTRFMSPTRSQGSAAWKPIAPLDRAQLDEYKTQLERQLEQKLADQLRLQKQQLEMKFENKYAEWIKLKEDEWLTVRQYQPSDATPLSPSADFAMNDPTSPLQASRSFHRLQAQLHSEKDHFFHTLHERLDRTQTRLATTNIIPSSLDDLTEHDVGIREEERIRWLQRIEQLEVQTAIEIDRLTEDATRKVRAHHDQLNEKLRQKQKFIDQQLEEMKLKWQDEAVKEYVQTHPPPPPLSNHKDEQSPSSSEPDPLASLEQQYQVRLTILDIQKLELEARERNLAEWKRRVDQEEAARNDATNQQLQLFVKPLEQERRFESELKQFQAEAGRLLEQERAASIEAVRLAREQEQKKAEETLQSKLKQEIQLLQEQAGEEKLKWMATTKKEYDRTLQQRIDEEKKSVKKWYADKLATVESSYKDRLAKEVEQGVEAHRLKWQQKQERQFGIQTATQAAKQQQIHLSQIKIVNDHLAAEQQKWAQREKHFIQMLDKEQQKFQTQIQQLQQELQHNQLNHQQLQQAMKQYPKNLLEPHQLRSLELKLQQEFQVREQQFQAQYKDYLQSQYIAPLHKEIQTLKDQLDMVALIKSQPQPQLQLRGSSDREPPTNSVTGLKSPWTIKNVPEIVSKPLGEEKESIPATLSPSSFAPPLPSIRSTDTIKVASITPSVQSSVPTDVIQRSPSLESNGKSSNYEDEQKWMKSEIEELERQLQSIQVKQQPNTDKKLSKRQSSPFLRPAFAALGLEPNSPSTLQPQSPVRTAEQVTARLEEADKSDYPFGSSILKTKQLMEANKIFSEKISPIDVPPPQFKVETPMASPTLSSSPMAASHRPEEEKSLLSLPAPIPQQIEQQPLVTSFDTTRALERVLEETILNERLQAEERLKQQELAEAKNEEQRLRMNQLEEELKATKESIGQLTQLVATSQLQPATSKPTTPTSSRKPLRLDELKMDSSDEKPAFPQPLLRDQPSSNALDLSQLPTPPLSPHQPASTSGASSSLIAPALSIPPLSFSSPMGTRPIKQTNGISVTLSNLPPSLPTPIPHTPTLPARFDASLDLSSSFSTPASIHSAAAAAELKVARERTAEARQRMETKLHTTTPFQLTQRPSATAASNVPSGSAYFGFPVHSTSTHVVGPTNTSTGSAVPSTPLTPTTMPSPSFSTVRPSIPPLVPSSKVADFRALLRTK